MLPGSWHTFPAPPNPSLAWWKSQSLWSLLLVKDCKVKLKLWVWAWLWSWVRRGFFGLVWVWVWVFFPWRSPFEIVNHLFWLQLRHHFHGRLERVHCALPAAIACCQWSYRETKSGKMSEFHSQWKLKKTLECKDKILIWL